MRRLMYMAALTLVATLVLASAATAQQMNGQHMMPNGQMMDNDMMASPPASASATPSATANGQMNGNMMASASASASASPSATPSATATASTTAKARAPRTHHGGGGSSASAVGDRLPRTGGMPWVAVVSVGTLVLFIWVGPAAYGLSRRSA